VLHWFAMKNLIPLFLFGYLVAISPSMVTEGSESGYTVRVELKTLFFY
jgi:hypothetical protein